MRRPLFLARAVYRRRRLRDAARLLPVFGFFLLMLPAFGHSGQAEGGTAVFIFLVWGFLIALAALLAPGLSEPEPDSATRAEDDD